MPIAETLTIAGRQVQFEVKSGIATESTSYSYTQGTVTSGPNGSVTGSVSTTFHDAVWLQAEDGTRLQCWASAELGLRPGHQMRVVRGRTSGDWKFLMFVNDTNRMHQTFPDSARC